MKHKKGFTLVELLVVIAIITILAGIVAPKVQNWIARSKMARAVSEIRNMDLALTKMLADSGKSNFAQFFGQIEYGGRLLPGLAALYKMYNNSYSPVFYELLRRGKDAELALKFDARSKLSPSYMDLGFDPWGTQYQFYVQPLRAGVDMYFRSYRPPNTPLKDGSLQLDAQGLPTYFYSNDDVNGRRKDSEDALIRGNPPADNRLGFPAPTDLPVYIFSPGADMVDDAFANQNPAFNDKSSANLRNGGDDINNWDNAAGWTSFY